MLQWGLGPFRTTHRLTDSEIFTDAGLADLLDRMPRDAVHAYVMGNDPETRDTWKRGLIGDATGAELLAVARSQTLWLNVMGVNKHIPELGALVDELYSDIRKGTGDLPEQLKATLLISSPNAQVFYHADNQPNALWHLRGSKRVYVYPQGDPYISDAQLERIVAGVADEQLPYRSELDDASTKFDLEPGDVAWWPQNRPHRVVNLEGLNVSLSIERRTAASTQREKRQAANFYLRRAIGRAPYAVYADGRLGSMSSRVIAGVGARLAPGTARVIEPTFVVDPAAPGGVRALS